MLKKKKKKKKCGAKRMSQERQSPRDAFSFLFRLQHYFIFYDDVCETRMTVDLALFDDSYRRRKCTFKLCVLCTDIIKRSIYCSEIASSRVSEARSIVFPFSFTYPFLNVRFVLSFFFSKREKKFKIQ